MRKLIITLLIVLISFHAAVTAADGLYPLPAHAIFTYEQLSDKLHTLAAENPDLVTLQSLGKSVENREIWAVTLGKGSKKVLVTGAMHGREWITAPVTAEIIALYIQAYKNDTYFRGEPVRHFLYDYSITFIPMVNPDGVTLAQMGADAFPQRKTELLAMNASGWGSDFRVWKANIRGVDINRNFDAYFHEQSNSVIKSPTPSYAFYKGPYAESEPETKVVADWIRANHPELVFDYHSMGELIYWYSFQTGAALERDKAIAQAISDASGYTMESMNIPLVQNSTMQQWVNKILKSSCFVVEVGDKPSHHLTMADFPTIFKQTRYLPLIGVQKLPSFRPFVPTISVNLPAAINMVTGNSEQLTAAIFPADASNKDVRWSSTNPAAVAVNENGELTALSKGAAYITATTESGAKQSSVLVTVYSPEDTVPEPEPAVPVSFTSSTAAVNTNSLMISRIKSGTTVAELLAGIQERDYLKMFSKTAEVSGSTPVATGYTVKILDGSVVVKTYTAIVTGDVNGDSKITVTDMIATKSHLLGSSAFKGEFLYATDTNGDGKVSITDFIQIKSHILGKEAVVAREY